MTHDDRDDENDWDDDPENDGDEADVTTCPACHAEVYDDAESCPACGHWFLSDDREVMRRKTHRQGETSRSPAGGMVIKVVALLLVIALLLGLLM